MPNPVVLFIPVSSPEGIGEYMRSLVLAQALAAQFPHLDIQFVLNKHAPTAASCPFKTHLLNQSATKEKAAVNQLLQSLQPSLVVFDCSGRASQAQMAKRVGAKVVFISQHQKKRAKGFALRRLAALDSHWITQFKFVDGDLSPIERLKLKLLNKPAPLFIGPVFAAPSPVFAEADLPEAVDAFTPGAYSLWAAGGGGHQVNGVSATELFYQAALTVATPEQPAIVVTGGNFKGELASTDSVKVVKSMPNQQLMTLIAHAGLVVSGGGDMMGQAIVLGKTIVAVPVAKDQPDRVLACANQGLIYPATLAKADIVAQCQKGWTTPLKPSQQFTPGLEVALADMARLLALPKP